MGDAKITSLLIMRSIFEEDTKTQIDRIVHNEKFVMLPVKVAVCLAAGAYLYYYETSHGPFMAFRYQLGLYAVSNLIFFYLLLQMSQIHLNMLAVRFSAYVLSMIDNLFLCHIIYVTGGMESQLFWLFAGLMIRNAANFPSLLEQTVLNTAFISFYVGVLFLENEDFSFLRSEIFWTRIGLFFVISFCGWGVLNLVRRMRAEVRQAEEMSLRDKIFQSQERLATEVAHELKNPLGIINNAIYLLKKRLKTIHNDSVVTKQMTIIEKEIQRSDRIITDLLGYAHRRDGKISAVNVHESMDQALSMVRQSLNSGTAAVEIKRVYLEGLPQIFVDPGQWQQVFINVFTNAFEAMQGKAGQLIITTILESAIKEIVIEVRDTGVGIPPDMLERVIDSFYTTKESGTGLGLAIVKNIIDSYNGRLTIESIENEGTKVTIRLPLILVSRS